MAEKKGGDTYGPWVASLGGGGGGEGAVGGAAGGVAEGAGASGGGISTCFQSCPSSTMRAMRVPRRTLRLPAAICKAGERGVKRRVRKTLGKSGSFTALSATETA